MAAKLQPVCRALNIDKDDFASKRIMAAYEGISKEWNLRVQDPSAQSAYVIPFYCLSPCVYSSIYV